MKILFLIPPSEGKNTQGFSGKEVLTYDFKKPIEIVKNITEKDLKCSGKRFEEGVKLNKTLCDCLPLNPKGVPESGSILSVNYVMNRYSGVMYNAINYEGMNIQGKQYFDTNFAILSGMYGILKPQDIIGNYKLPIEAKGLVAYWKEQITESLNDGGYDYIVNMLPLSYMKMIDFKTLVPKVVNINFQVEKEGKIVKMAHGVKKIKGEWIKQVCEKLGSFPFSKGDIEEGWIFKIFGGEKIETKKTIEINILHS